MIEVIVAFLSMFVVDILYGIFIKYVNQEKEVQAGIFSGLIYFVACIATIDFIENHWLLIPATIGAGLGTYVGVLINKRMPS